MPKPTLIKEDQILERQIIETLEAGLKTWRSDLSYPESYSDMQACVRGLLIAFEVKRRPLPYMLRFLCGYCEGIGKLISKSEHGYLHSITCTDCRGKGYTLGE